MCVLLVAHRDHPAYALVVAANRDEFHERPTAPASYWDDEPRILGGRDLERGGSWLAIDTSGRFAAVTNIRRDAPQWSPRSRGLLVADFLRGAAGPAAYAEALTGAYTGANLLAGDANELVWWSSSGAVQRLAAGTYGLSNAQLDSPWPKVNRLKHAFGALRESSGEALIEGLLELLRDAATPADDELPSTGVGLELERVLGPIFIRAQHYGTRCSTVVLREPGGHTTFVERRFDAHGQPNGESRYVLETSA